MYFENKPDVTLEPEDIVAFVCLRNEAIRLPYFLKYYRDLGVNHFFIIDNQSNDGSSEILENEPDVTGFFSDGSYKGSAAGRLWMEELANHYGNGHWCFTVDVDELFVFPFMESSTLGDFIQTLEHEGAEGVFSVFLDMYSDRPLSETQYTPGTNFLDVCPYYEASTYSLMPAALPPYLSITGGPRWRSLWDPNKVNSGPMMKKIPLVKWQPGFFYNYSTHSHSDIRLSQTTAVLQHFKFFSFFSELAQQEAKRGDRRQTKDYQNYANKLSSDDPCFLGSASRRYNDSLDFVRAGITATSDHWKKHVLEQADNLTALMIRKTDVRPSDTSILNLQSSGMGLGSLAFLWPHVNNSSKFEITTGAAREIKARDLALLCDRHASNVTLMDIRDEQLLVKIEPVLWTQTHCRFTLVASCGGKVVECYSLEKDVAYDNMLTKSFEASIHCIPLAGTLLGNFVSNTLSVRPRINLSLMVESHDNALPLTEYVDRPRSALQYTKPIRRGKGVHFNYSTLNTGAANQPYNGTLESVKDGVVRGWVVEKLPSNPFTMLNWDVPVSVYLNDWYVGETTHTYARKDLSFEKLARNGAQSVECKEQSGYGFDFPLPISFFEEKGITDFILELRVARRNIVLSRSPCQWSGRNARWVHETESWHSEDAATEQQPHALAK